MKKYNYIFSMISILTMILFQSSIAYALGERGEGRTNAERNKTSEPETVKWIGTIKDDADTHTTDHEHELVFVKKDNGDTFDIEDSPELVKFHHETEKNYIVEIEAEKTPKFLFWGGNLIVKNFKVIEEASERIPHRATAAKSSPAKRSFTGRLGY